MRAWRWTCGLVLALLALWGASFALPAGLWWPAACGLTVVSVALAYCWPTGAA